MESPLGLYIHVPFCSAICNYCNFNRGLFDAALKERYVDALEREIRAAGGGEPAGSAGSPHADTIFFGGGTPSLLEPHEIGRLITACRESFAVASDAEVTLETNPETSSAVRMAQFRDAGVTRVSFGVQSFHDPELRRLGRIHTAGRARDAVDEARAAGFDNVSVDLMMWLPQQTQDDWRRNIDSLIALAPEHASLYLLELYPNAPLKEDMARSGWSQAPDDDAAEMYMWGMERLEAAGLRQYEISNVARPGRESRHNLKYWRDGEWLGFGCGAHSTRGGARWKNVSGTDDYVRRVAAGESLIVERRELDATGRMEEALFTGLRLTDGVDTAAIRRRYGVDPASRYGAALAPFVEEGLVRWEGSRLSLTRRGMLLANEILQVFV